MKKVLLLSFVTVTLALCSVVPATHADIPTIIQSSITCQQNNDGFTSGSCEGSLYAQFGGTHYITMSVGALCQEPGYDSFPIVVSDGVEGFQCENPYQLTAQGGYDIYNAVDAVSTNLQAWTAFFNHYSGIKKKNCLQQEYQSNNGPIPC